LALADDKGYCIHNGEKKERGTVLELIENALAINGHTLFRRYKSPGCCCVYNGTEGKRYKFIDEKSLKLLENGRYTYQAVDLDAGSYWYVIDGKETAGYSNVYWFEFSHDGKHYAYSAREGKDHEYLIIDDTKHPLPGPVSVLEWSQDSKHLACTVHTNQEGNAVGAVFVDGEIASEWYDKIPIVTGQYVFSNDGSRFAHVAKRGDAMFYAIDGVKQKEYAKVERFQFSPDGERFAYVASRQNEKGAEFVVTDGEEGKAYERIDGPLFDHSGQHVFHFAKFGDKYKSDEGFFVIDGIERERYERVSPRYSNTVITGDDKFGYVAVRDGAYYWIEETKAVGGH